MMQLPLGDETTGCAHVIVYCCCMPTHMRRMWLQGCVHRDGLQCGPGFIAHERQHSTEGGHGLVS
jgi:hypothetical protein